jgi:putative ABC transport system ATP-binding protein
MVLLRELHAEDGTTIVVITHDRDVAAMLPRRIDIRDGRIERDSGAVLDGRLS